MGIAQQVPEYDTLHRARPGLAPLPLGKSRIGSSLRAFAAHFLPTDRLPAVFGKWSALSPTLFSCSTHSPRQALFKRHPNI
jgi:hypothetical protein